MDNDLERPKRLKLYYSEELLVNFALLKFNDFVQVLIIDICCRNTIRKRLSQHCLIRLSGGEERLVSSSKCMAIASFSFLRNVSYFRLNFDITCIHNHPAEESLRSYSLFVVSITVALFRFSFSSMMSTPQPSICRLRWLEVSKITAMYSKMRINSVFFNFLIIVVPSQKQR